MAASKEGIDRARRIAKDETIQAVAMSVLERIQDADGLYASEKVRIGRQKSGGHKDLFVQVKEENRVKTAQLNVWTGKRRVTSSQVCCKITVYADEEEVGSLFRPQPLGRESLIQALADIDGIVDMDWLEPEQPGDEYKVRMLKLMLACETTPGVRHYGANLQHASPDTKPLTIDAGGLRALIDYYGTHKAKFD